jgi:prepilin-type N-terminal cleavage/methylation domain-containing protein
MRKNNGFTLIEIAIVTAIVGIGVIMAVSNLQEWNRHNNFVGFQRQVFSEIQEARSRAFSIRRQYRLTFDLDAETLLLERGNAGSGSTVWTADRATVSVPGGSSINDIAWLRAGAGATPSSGKFYLMFSPGGDVYRWASGPVVTPLDTANIHLSNDSGETATVQLFCWTGKARLSVGTI